MTIVLAYLCHSVWALAIGSVIGAVLQTMLGHLTLPSRSHAMRLDRNALHALFQFGRWIFLATLVTFVGAQGLLGIQGVLVSPEVLGTIYIATTISGSLAQLTLSLIGTVGFPAMSIVYRQQPGRVKEVLERIRFRILSLILPGFILLSITANYLVHLLYDKRYAAAGTYLAISAIESALGVLPAPYQDALLASGNSRAHFFIMFVTSALRVGGLLAGFYGGGVTGMLTGIAAASFVSYFISAWYAKKMGWLSLRLDLIALGFILLGSGISFGCHMAGY